MADKDPETQAEQLPVQATTVSSELKFKAYSHTEIQIESSCYLFKIYCKITVCCLVSSVIPLDPQVPLWRKSRDEQGQQRRRRERGDGAGEEDCRRTAVLPSTTKRVCHLFLNGQKAVKSPAFREAGQLSPSRAAWPSFIRAEKDAAST